MKDIRSVLGDVEAPERVIVVVLISRFFTGDLDVIKVQVLFGTVGVFVRVIRNDVSI